MQLTFILALHLASLLGLMSVCRCISNNTQIENQLETEIDLRDPRSFLPTVQKEYLIVRTPIFTKISHYTSTGAYISTDMIADYEKFADT